MIDGSPEALAFAVADGRNARRPGEVTLGGGALERLGAEIGEPVEPAVAGREPTARVVGVTSSPTRPAAAR